MAHGRPWYKRNGSDFVMAAMHFPDNDYRYAYSAIIDMLNDHDRPLADSPAFICGFTGLSRKKWSIVRAYLIAREKLCVTDRDGQPGDGYLSNPRFERERAQRIAEHEESVQHGKRGGQKSAELRARQGQLNLEDHPDDQANNRPDKWPDSTPDSGVDHSETRMPKRQNTAKKNQPPPQASRARERASEARDQNHTTNDHSTDAARAPPVDRSNQTSAPGPDRDLLALLDRCSEAAGYHPIRPGEIAREVDLIRSWRDAGLDFDGHVIPHIRDVIAGTGDPTSSFRRFDKALRHEHAKRQALNGRPSRPLDGPQLTFPDEAPEIAPIRQALLKALGAQPYVLFAHSIRLEVGDGNNPDQRILRAHTRGRFSPFWDDNRPRLLAQIARAHGLHDAWKGK